MSGPFLFILSSIMITALFSCGNTQEKGNTTSGTDSTKQVSIPDGSGFRAVIDGKQTELYTLSNKNGMKAAITNYGGRLVSLLVPDQEGHLTDVVVGFTTVQDYVNASEPYFGATIGRFGNRIANATFLLEGTKYKLFANNGPNTLHGGKKGFQYVVWDAVQPNDSTLELRYVSKNMEEGFPGTLNVKVIYSLTSGNGFKCVYEATTDKTTVVNLTNHAFFNLNGEGSGTINNHTLQIEADAYTPVDSTLIPTGKLEAVKGTPFDFTFATTIGKRVEDDNEQLKFGKGYDHNFVLRQGKTSDLHHAATVVGDLTGIKMDVYTQEPGLQFYGGNFMQSKNTFKSGAKDDFRTAFCLETQHFPDAPNQPSFPSTVLKPGETYQTTSVYQFSIIKPQ